MFSSTALRLCAKHVHCPRKSFKVGGLACFTTVHSAQTQQQTANNKCATRQRAGYRCAVGVHAGSDSHSGASPAAAAVNEMNGKRNGLRRTGEKQRQQHKINTSSQLQFSVGEGMQGKTETASQQAQQDASTKHKCRSTNESYLHTQQRVCS